MIFLDIFLVLSLLCSVLPNIYGTHVHVGVNPDGDDSTKSSTEDQKRAEVEILHSLADKDFTDESLTLQFTAFEELVEVNLKKVDSQLADSDTPVFVTIRYNDSSDVTFLKLDNGTLGKVVALYQDDHTGSSVVVSHSDDGSPVFVGTIGGFSITFKATDDSSSGGRKKRSVKRRSANGLTASELHYVSELSRKKREAMLAPVAGLLERFKRQAEASNDELVLYPQLLVVSDYGEEVQHISFNDHLVYLLAFFNGVDLAFQQLSDPEVRLHIAGIVVDLDPKTAPYIENNRNASGAIDAVAALGEMGEFYATNLTDLPPSSYNIIVTLINDYICDHHEEDFCSPLLAGVSSLDKRCVDNQPSSSMVAIVEDNLAFSGIRTAIHELGHIMGAEHDGDPGAEDCPFADGYLMAKYNDSSDVSLTWSNCSRRFFTDELNSKGFDCLRNSPDTNKDGSPLPPILPGGVSGLYHQCLALGYVRNCEGPQNCQALTCSNTTYAFSVDCEKAGIPAAQGSPCGGGRRCINGDCVLP